MRKKNEPRTEWLTIRMTPEEYTELERLRAQTTSSTLSEYARKVLLHKPVVVKYRNQSLDDFLADMLQLRQDLNQVGNNFNQAVHRLHTLQTTADIHQWVLVNEQDKTHLFRQIENIHNNIQKANQLWSQK
jgi:hypothetical protein